MRKHLCLFLLSIIVLSINGQSFSYHQLGRIENNLLIVKHNINLQGKTCNLPQGITLVIDGGLIRNGTLIGHRTKIRCSRQAFDQVKIKGVWNVPSISSSMFADLSYENALKDVVALAQPDVQNIITIEDGEYQVAAYEKDYFCLQIPANTTLILKGTIRLLPNQLPKYEIIRAKGENIIIKGHGTIIGDKHTHLGKDGEWGMGITLRGAINSSVDGLTIKDSWGDCIYIGGNSKQVLIKNCILDHGRREGISVTKADGVTIRNCKITNVGGTNPQYAIDLEPNKGADTVNHIVIENVEITNCVGGILATCSRTALRDGSMLGNFSIRNCNIRAYQRYPIMIRRFNHAVIDNCFIKTGSEKAAVHVAEANKIMIKNCKVEIDKSLKSTMMDEKKDENRIHLIKCKKVSSTNNSIIEM